MPLLVLNRNYVLATLRGHRIRFVKDEPTYVPPAVVPDAVAIGATPADGSDPNVLPPDPKGANPTASDPTARKAAIMAAIDKIIERNSKDDFNAANQPKADAVSKVVDFKVDGKELAVLLQEYYESKAA